RGRMTDEAHVFAKVMKGKEEEGAKYRDYFEYDELLKKVPSHRALAIFRGRNESILSIEVNLKLDDDQLGKRHPLEILLANHRRIEHKERAADDWLEEVVRWTWR